MTKQRVAARVARLTQALTKVRAKAEAGGPRAADYAKRCKEYEVELATLRLQFGDDFMAEHATGTEPGKEG